MAHSTVKDEAFGIIPVITPLDGSPRRYLLIFHNKGHWGFPKGHKDGDETDLQTAQRELQEETGLTTYDLVEGFQLSEQYQFFDPNGIRIEKKVVYFVAIVPTSATGDPPPVTIQIEELANYRWCHLEEALALISFPEARRLLQACDQHFQATSVSS